MNPQWNFFDGAAIFVNVVGALAMGALAGAAMGEAYKKVSRDTRPNPRRYYR